MFGRKNKWPKPRRVKPMRWGTFLGWECPTCGRKFSALDLPADEMCRHADGPFEMPNYIAENLP